MDGHKTSHLPIRYFLALLWAHPILHVSGIRVKNLKQSAYRSPLKWMCDLTGSWDAASAAAAEVTRRWSKLCNVADNLSFSPNIITTINPSLCLQMEAHSASENSLDNANNRTCNSAPLWQFMKLWTRTPRRSALMLCIREVFNSNYGRGTVYQEDFVFWLKSVSENTKTVHQICLRPFSLYFLFTLLFVNHAVIQSTLLTASWNEIC